MSGVQERGVAHSLKSSLPDPRKATHSIFTEESSQNYVTRADPEKNRCPDTQGKSGRRMAMMPGDTQKMVLCTPRREAWVKKSFLTVLRR